METVYFNRDTMIIFVCFAGCDCRKRRSWQIFHDSAILQGDFHQGLQKDNRSGFPRKTHNVSAT